jgi:tRNA(fMet)-specific endonuclease VapC
VKHARGILDTSNVVMPRELNDPRVLPDEPLITAITLAELTVGPLVATTDHERAARQAQLRQAESDFDALPFDARAARAFGRVPASLRQSGRNTTARSYDAMIAATALVNALPVYTCDADDFAGIDGLDVVAMPVPLR